MSSLDISMQTASLERDLHLLTAAQLAAVLVMHGSTIYNTMK